jgi:hypothetical protein
MNGTILTLALSVILNAVAVWLLPNLRLCILQEYPYILQLRRAIRNTHAYYSSADSRDAHS